MRIKNVEAHGCHDKRCKPTVHLAGTGRVRAYIYYINNNNNIMSRSADPGTLKINKFHRHRYKNVS